MPRFIQLTTDNCKYLLDLIKDLDSDTQYTKVQRVETTARLQRIQNDPNSSKLTFKDTEYLLDLIDDDDIEGLEIGLQRLSARKALNEIQNLQNARFEETLDIEQQRTLRRERRLRKQQTQEAFTKTTSHTESEKVQ